MPALFANFISVQLKEDLVFSETLIPLKSTLQFPSIVTADDYFKLLLTDGTNSELVTCVSNEKQEAKLGVIRAKAPLRAHSFSASNSWVELVADAEEYELFVRNAMGDSASVGDVTTPKMTTGGVGAFGKELHSRNGALYWGTDNLTELDAAKTNLPIGSVVMFAKDIQNIPSNWKLCDGKPHTVNGKTINTPNLIDKFIKADVVSDVATPAKGSATIRDGGKHSHTNTVDVSQASVFDTETHRTGAIAITEATMGGHRHTLDPGITTTSVFHSSFALASTMASLTYSASSSFPAFDSVRNPFTFTPSGLDFWGNGGLVSDVKGSAVWGQPNWGVNDNWAPAIEYAQNSGNPYLSNQMGETHSHSVTNDNLSHTHDMSLGEAPDHPHAIVMSGSKSLNYATDCQRYKLMFIVKVADPTPITFGVSNAK